MPVVEMDPEEILALIEGEPDVLQPEAKKLDFFYKHTPCPRCKGECRKEYDVRHAFSDPDTLVPRALLRCTSCNNLHDPHSRIELERGDLGKIIEIPIED